jgi:hypothetical protein
LNGQKKSDQKKAAPRQNSGHQLLVFIRSCKPVPSMAALKWLSLPFARINTGAFCGILEGDKKQLCCWLSPDNLKFSKHAVLPHFPTTGL